MRVVIALQLVLVLLLTQTTLSRLVRVVQKAEPTQVIKQTGLTLSSLRLPQRVVVREQAVGRLDRLVVQRVAQETPTEPLRNRRLLAKVMLVAGAVAHLSLVAVEAAALAVQA